MKSTFVLSKKVFILAGCIAGVLLASGIGIGVAVSHNVVNNGESDTSVSDVANKNEALANNNGAIDVVSLADAKKAALKDAGLSEDDVSFSQAWQDSDGNSQVYDIEFSTPDKKYEYEINVSDGSIIEKDVRALNIQQSNGSNEDIGLEKAKEIALKDAKFSASDVKFIKTVADKDENITIYDIEFTASNKKYDYEINAVDGAIIEVDVRALNNNQGTASNGNSGNNNVNSGSNNVNSNSNSGNNNVNSNSNSGNNNVNSNSNSGNTGNNGYIGVEKAKQIALSDANVSAGNATFTQAKLDSDERTPKYDIEFRTSDKEYDYEINAKNGSIIEKDVENIKTPQSQQNSKPSGNNNNSYIGVEKAKQIALSDANVSAGNATFTKAKLDSDERTPKYDIEFRTSNKEYDYEINALNGSIIEKDVENIKTPQSQQSSKPSGNNNNSYIGVEKAKQIALSDANVSAGNATFTKAKLDSDERTPKYDIEFRTSNKKYDYEINALNGNIIEKDVENIKTQQSQQSSKPSGSYIGEEKARQIALSHAGLSASEVRFIKTKLDRDDGRYVYEIEFVSGVLEYDYTIDAISGKILEYDKDFD